MGERPSAPPGAAGALVRKIRIVLANHAHLDLVTNEAFQITLGEKLQQAEDLPLVPATPTAVERPMGPSQTERMPAGGGGGPLAATGLAVDYQTAVGLVYSILERIRLPYDQAAVEAWTAAACSTFALSRAEANTITANRLRFAVDWVLRCLADHAIRGTQDYFHRQFLLGFSHGTSLGDSPLQLSGGVAHGVYGNIWLQSKEKLAKVRQNTQGSILAARQSSQEGGAPGSPANSSGASAMLHPGTPPALPRMSDWRTLQAATTGERLGLQALRILQSSSLGRVEERTQHVVISISKALCRLPPELMSQRLRHLMDMEPIPYVLPLTDAYEDLEHIHLVYEGLHAQAVCLTDKVFDDMHLSEDDAEENGFCEATVQQVVWKLLTALKQAHGRGLVHGCLRMGCCYLNDPDSYDSLQVLEFGLAELFECTAATPPGAVLTPLHVDRTDPVPPYRRDFQCIAEMTYLMLGGLPVCSLNAGAEELERKYRRGALSFADKVFAKTSENAKAFVLDLMRPVNYKKFSKIQPCHEVALHMSHRWFRPHVDSSLNELYDVIVMRKYDTWRNTLRLRINLVKILADHISVSQLAQVREALLAVADRAGKVSWAQLVPQILHCCPVLHLLQKVNKAFGENEDVPAIHVLGVCRTVEAWRRKRVREVLWQVFSRSKAFNGVMPSDSFQDGLTSGVLHVWSRPLRVLDVVLPPDGPDSPRKLEELLAGSKTVSFLDLVARTDAAERVPT